jgi:hypothetical protein
VNGAAGAPRSRPQDLLAGIRPGFIVVLHEGSAKRRGVVEMTDELLTVLADRRLAAVAVPQLVALRR